MWDHVWWDGIPRGGLSLSFAEAIVQREHAFVMVKEIDKDLGYPSKRWIIKSPITHIEGLYESNTQEVHR